MPNFKMFKPHFKAIAHFLKGKFNREAIQAACFDDGEAAYHSWRFNSWNASLIEWRWGSVISFVTALLVVEVALKHAEALAEFFEEGPAMKQMRKWLGWYTKGFHGAAALRGALASLESLADLRAHLYALPLEEEFPLRALRMGRAKRGGKQRVKLPEGYLDNLQDDTPPRGPRTLKEIEDWERAHSGG